MGLLFSRGDSTGNNNNMNFDPLHEDVLYFRQRNLNEHDMSHRNGSSNNSSNHAKARSFYVVFGQPSIRYRRERTRGPLIFDVRRNVHINDNDEIVDESNIGSGDNVEHARSISIPCAISSKQHFELIFSPTLDEQRISNYNNSSNDNSDDEYCTLHFQLSLTQPMERLAVYANVQVEYIPKHGIQIHASTTQSEQNKIYTRKITNSNLTQAPLDAREGQMEEANNEEEMEEWTQSNKPICLYNARSIVNDNVEVRVPAKILRKTSRATFTNNKLTARQTTHQKIITQNRQIHEATTNNNNNHHNNNTDEEETPRHGNNHYNTRNEQELVEDVNEHYYSNNHNGYNNNINNNNYNNNYNNIYNNYNFFNQNIAGHGMNDNERGHSGSTSADANNTAVPNVMSVTHEKWVTSAPIVIVSYIRVNTPKRPSNEHKQKVKVKVKKQEQQKTVSQIRVGTSETERKDIFCLKTKSKVKEEVAVTIPIDSNNSNNNNNINNSDEEENIVYKEIDDDTVWNNTNALQESEQLVKSEREEQEQEEQEEQEEKQILYTFLDYSPESLRRINSRICRQTSIHTDHDHDDNANTLVTAAINEMFKRLRYMNKLSTNEINNRQTPLSHSVNNTRKGNEVCRAHTSTQGITTSNLDAKNDSSHLERQSSTTSSVMQNNLSVKLSLNVVAQLLQIGTEVYLLEDVFDLGVTEENDDQDNNNEGNNNNDDDDDNEEEKEREEGDNVNYNNLNTKSNVNLNGKTNNNNVRSKTTTRVSLFDVELDDKDERDVCVICLSNPNNTTLLPCRHKCVCYACAAQLKLNNNRCPICRAVIERTMTL